MNWSLEQLQRKMEMDEAEEEFEKAMEQLDRAKANLRAELGFDADELERLIEMRRQAKTGGKNGY